MPTLQVHLLGDFRLVYDGAPVTTFFQGRLQALLAYLLLHRHTPQSRQRIAFLFWPDSVEPQARNNLRQLLHRLRKSLPAADEFIQADTKTVQWWTDAPYSLDVIDLERDLARAAQAAEEGHVAAERAALQSAVDHYRGDLLPGCYDEWILPERRRLRQAYLESLERLMLLSEAQRDYAAAIDYAERLLRSAPLHETTYRRLMRLHALHGERASALRVYHACHTVLQRELGVEPNPDTKEAYRRLLNIQPPALLHPQPPSLSRSRPSLAGRQEEWGRLLAAWRECVAGRAVLVLISGEAGIGKTRLAEEFLEWAAQQGITIARTRAYAAEGQLPYAPLIELLRSEPLSSGLAPLELTWLTELARLMPELRSQHPHLVGFARSGGSAQRPRRFEALARAILGGREALILFLDDLQCCDADTLEWIHYFMHFNSGTRLLVLGTVSLEEVEQRHPLNALLLALRLREQITEIALGPLDPDDTATLAEEMIGRQLDAAEGDRLYNYTEGNPLFVVETMLAAVGGETSVAQMLAGAAFPEIRASQLALPRRVHAMIQARLQHLSPPALDLAGLAATIGRVFTTDVLVHASEYDEDKLVQTLDELWRRRLVREHENDVYDFSHDRVREVAYAELSSARRRLNHRRVAAALETIHATSLDALSGQIAAHHEQAGNSLLAAAYYVRAAIVAQRTASSDEVTDILTRALSLLPDLPDAGDESPQKVNL